MEKIKIMIGVPSAGTVPMTFCMSVWKLMAMFPALQSPHYDLEIGLKVSISSNWISNRETIVMQAIEEGATHILFLDDDMVFEPEILKILFDRNVDVVLTNYLIKEAPPARFTAIGLDQQRVPTTESSTGLQQILFSGFGVSLIRTRIFEKLEQPWFLPWFSKKEIEYGTEDMAFFDKVIASGVPVWLDHDASKLISHTGRREWNWQRDA